MDMHVLRTSQGRCVTSSKALQWHAYEPRSSRVWKWAAPARSARRAQAVRRQTLPLLAA